MTTPELEDIAQRLYEEHLANNPDFPAVPWARRPDIVRDAWRAAARKKYFDKEPTP